MKLFTILLNIAKRIKTSFTRLTTLETDVGNLETRMDEAIEVYQTQIALPSSVSVPAGGRGTLLSNVDIRTLTCTALDDISGMTKTLVGVVYLWTNGANGIPIDILVMDNKVNLICYFPTGGNATAVRLLTFWK